MLVMTCPNWPSAGPTENMDPPGLVQPIMFPQPPPAHAPGVLAQKHHLGSARGFQCESVGKAQDARRYQGWVGSTGWHHLMQVPSKPVPKLTCAYSRLLFLGGEQLLSTTYLAGKERRFRDGRPCLACSRAHPQVPGGMHGSTASYHAALALRSGKGLRDSDAQCALYCMVSVDTCARGG